MRDRIEDERRLRTRPGDAHGSRGHPPLALLLSGVEMTSTSSASAYVHGMRTTRVRVHVPVLRVRVRAVAGPCGRRFSRRVGVEFLDRWES